MSLIDNFGLILDFIKRALILQRIKFVIEKNLMFQCDFFGNQIIVYEFFIVRESIPAELSQELINILDSGFILDFFDKGVKHAVVDGAVDHSIQLLT